MGPKERNICKFTGELIIDYDEGTITFNHAGDPRFQMLRITHLTTPIPYEVQIDMVALDKLTSYTPLDTNATESPA